MIRNSIKFCMLFHIFILSLPIDSSKPSPNNPSGQSLPLQVNAPKDFNSFIVTVAAGVTVAVVSKVCDHLLSAVFGTKDAQEQAVKLQQERNAQQHMALIFEFCKDDSYKEICNQLKLQYLESQIKIAGNKK